MGINSSSQIQFDDIKLSLKMLFYNNFKVQISQGRAQSTLGGRAIDCSVHLGPSVQISVGSGGKIKGLEKARDASSLKTNS